jgi:phosphohistidine phosphatase
MHMLHLLRHAKSSWKDDVSDRERRLTRRGREAARRVGRHFPATVGELDLVLCSSARRTRETLDLVLAEFAVRPRSLVEDELYTSNQEGVMERLRRLQEEYRNVLLIGHNPGLHELAVALADTRSPRFSALASGKFPTAARASLRIPEQWSALGRSRYELVDYVTADSLPDGELG